MSQNDNSTELVHAVEYLPVTRGGNSGLKPGQGPAHLGGSNTNKKRVGFATALRDTLIEEGMVEENIGGEMLTRIRRVIRKVYDCAEDGEPWAVQFIAERVEGKVTQPIHVPEDVRVLVLGSGTSMDEL